MNLLLLLTAFMASLTGMISGGRAMNTQVVSRVVEVEVQRVQRATNIVPVAAQAQPSIAVVAADPVAAKRDAERIIDIIDEFGGRRE